MRLLVVIACLAATPAVSDTVVAARTLRAQSIVGPSDITIVAGDVIGTYVSREEVIGLEARNVLYAGRPVRIDDLGPPAIIDRNQIVSVIYDTGGMRILAEGRALGRAGVGDVLRVMNLASHTVISGKVQENGQVNVSPPSQISQISN